MLKKISRDENICLKWNFISSPVDCLPNIQPQLHSCIACVYENCWWIGFIKNANSAEEDYDVQFMHPHEPAETFYWPQREDCCSVPPNHILCIVSTPEIVTQMGRSYKIDEHSQNLISKNWDIFKTSLMKGANRK